MLLFKIVFLFYDQVVAKLRYNKTLIKQTKASALLRKNRAVLTYISAGLPSLLWQYYTTVRSFAFGLSLNSSVDQSLFNI